MVLYDPFERPTFIEDMSRYDNPLFEADVMNHPDVMSNVENGFGFVGGGYRHSIEIPAATELVTLPDLD